MTKYNPSGIVVVDGHCRKLIIDGQMQCCRCDKWKDVEEFYVNRSSPTGRTSACKLCKVKSGADIHVNNFPKAMRKLVASHKRTGKRSPRRMEMNGASVVDVPMVIEMWNSQNGKCAVTGIPMTHVYGHGRSVMTNASIDRIDNSLGYVPGNVRLVCKAVNYMKHSMSDSEMISWCRAIIGGPVAETLGAIQS